MTTRRDVPQRHALELDINHYQTYLDDEGIPEADKRALTQAVWNIVVAFVDLGFEKHPLQMGASNSCGEGDDCLAVQPSNAVDSSNTYTASGGEYDR